MQDLVDLSGEEIQRGEDAAVRAEVVLLHHFFVVNRVADVDVRGEGDGADGRIEVDDVGWSSLRVEM